MSSILHDVDLSARGRIMRAAFELFADGGFRATTVRAIAARAGVSAGLIIHHFGDKEALRRECDDRVIRFIVGKSATDAPDEVLGGAATQFGPYLARMLSETGSSADSLFNGLLATARDTVESAIREGRMRQLGDVDAQAAALVTLGVAPFFLSYQLARWAGGDTQVGIARVAGPIAGIYAHGLWIDKSQAAEAR